MSLPLLRLEDGDCAIVLKTDGTMQTILPNVKSMNDVTHTIHTAHIILNVLQDPIAFQQARELLFKKYGTRCLVNMDTTPIPIVSKSLIN